MIARCYTQSHSHTVTQIYGKRSMLLHTVTESLAHTDIREREHVVTHSHTVTRIYGKESMLLHTVTQSHSHTDIWE
jgi:hypothetical protein